MAQPVQATEDLLDRLSKAENGEYFTLVKLKGAGVPADLELYFCKNKFAVVQVGVGGVFEASAASIEVSV